MLEIFSTLIEDIKFYLRPTRTKLLYPGVKFGRGTIADNKCDFGKNISICGKSVISSSKIDSYSYIGGNSLIKNCTIGKFCSIAPEVRIGLGIHPVDRISTYPGFYSNKASGAVKFFNDQTIQEHLPITIGNDVWIGTRAIIMDGITIGDGSVVSAGSIVTKDVEPYCIVGGVPAKLIKKRFDEKKIDLLLEFRWWEKDPEYLRKKAQLFTSPEEFFQFISENDKIK